VSFIAVWQLWDQSPQLFEFDSSLLIFLIDALHSARFGTFLADTEKERKTGTPMGPHHQTVSIIISNSFQKFLSLFRFSSRIGHAGKQQLMQKTISIWSYVDLKKFDFMNPLYSASSAAPLAPHPSQVKFWSGTRPPHLALLTRVACVSCSCRVVSCWACVVLFGSPLLCGGTEYYLRWACHAPAERAIKDIHVLKDYLDSTHRLL
jgi:hypothetical protein